LKFCLEFGQYTAIDIEVPLTKDTFMKILMFFYAYLLFNRVCGNIKKNVLRSKTFPSLVQNIGTPFPMEQIIYNYEINPKAFKAILNLVLQSGMGCLSVNGGVLESICAC
jgi:hypothetical protein